MIGSDRIPLSREAIASRMFRNAARQWGLNDTNMDNFDPVVRLLIEACSLEMYQLSNQLESVQERMIEKLARLLTPQVYVIPKPAHGIMHARGVDPESTLSNTMQFFYHKKIASKINGPLDSNLDVFFSPVGAYKVIDGDIKVVASGDNVYNVNDSYLQKETFLRTSKRIPYRTVWVGIDLNPRILDITNLSFFFDFKNTPDKDQYLSLIPFTQCSINNTPVHFHSGLYDLYAEAGKNVFQNSLEELYINNRIENFTSAYYKDQFITIDPKNQFLQNVAPLKQKYPVEFENILGTRELATFTKDLLWAKLTFRPEFSYDILDDLTISINCFPVVNRHRNEITYRLQQYFNIIPMISDEQFLSIEKVESTAADVRNDKEYKYYSFDQFDNSQKGTFTVRSGDLERFDSRNALEYMNYLAELLRDESRAFAALGQDFIASMIKLLNQSISQIEQKIKQNSIAVENSPAYLLINPVAEGDTIFARFWTCNGELGNFIRSGSKIELYEGSQFKKEGLVLMTTTTGGANKLKNTERLPAYKSVLISRGRIVTQEDIKAFCSFFLKGKAEIDALEINKGVGIGRKPLEGLIPTVDINIKAAKNEQLGTEEWDALKHELLVGLEEQSAVNLNYRVFVN